MENKIKKLNYNGSVIEFEVQNENVQVNATEMAKIFGTQVNEFLSNNNTKLFINECLKNGNSRFLGIENEEDLIVSKQKSGTWMHRVLALKFAAWLNPAFELWIYRTIENLIFGNRLREENYFKNKRELLNTKRDLDAEIKELRTKLANTSEGKLLTVTENQLKEVKARIAKIEQIEFGSIYTLFEMLPQNTQMQQIN